MQIELQLRKVLDEHALDNPGVIAEIARKTNRHRNTISKLYHNESQNPPLDVLGDICTWLAERGVRSGLPGILFGRVSPKLWAGVTAPGMVTMYLGEQTQPKVNISWISRRDAMVEMEIISHLSTRAKLEAVCVPFRAEFAATTPRNVDRRAFTVHVTRARTMYDQMHADLSRSSAILIGSQRVNYLLEHLVADLFHCKPFKAERGKPCVPFHFGFGSAWKDIESCFGGLRPPAGESGAMREGTYYLEPGGRWAHRPTVRGKEDSGIILTCSEPGSKGLILAIAGVTGQATEAMGRYLTHRSADFWPHTAEHRGRKLGVYVCHFKLSRGSDDPNAKVHAERMEVVRIEKEVLMEFLK